MRCFKLLGERVKARIFNSQVAELQIRAAISPNLLASLLGIFENHCPVSQINPEPSDTHRGEWIQLLLVSLVCSSLLFQVTYSAAIIPA